MKGRIQQHWRMCAFFGLLGLPVIHTLGRFKDFDLVTFRFQRLLQ